MSLKSLVAALLALLFASAVAAQDLPAPVVVPPLTAENTWLLDRSDGGRVTIQLRPDIAPNTVERIKTLTQRGFYNGLKFHRVIEGFMAQGGDPKGDGTGGSDLPDLKAEFNRLPHVRGAVAMARSSAEDSANSQFYIVMLPRFTLDNKYTVFGRVVDGMQNVDAIQRGEPPANPTTIVRASLGTDNVPPPPPGALPATAPEPTLPPTLPPTPAPAAPAGATPQR
jgi:peptidylprolyl isomerase